MAAPRIVKRRRYRQPTGAVGISKRLPRGVYVGYPVGGNWYNATTGVTTDSRTYYDASVSADGRVLVPNTNSKTIDLNITSAAVYGVLYVFDVRVAALTSSSSAFNLLATSQDYTGTTGDQIRAGSSTGSVAGETLCIVDSATSNRTGMTDTLSIGRHVVVLQWDLSLGKYIWFLNGSLATPVETATPSALKSFGGYMQTRVNSTQANMCPALVAISHVPEVDLAAYMGNPWELLEDERFFYPVYASAAGPTLSDLKAVNVTGSTVQGTYDYAF